MCHHAQRQILIIQKHFPDNPIVEFVGFDFRIGLFDHGIFHVVVVMIDSERKEGTGLIITAYASVDDEFSQSFEGA